MNQPVSLPLALFGGGGIGLLFGVIMGTTVTPVIGVMLGALTTVLAGILGLNDGNFNNTKSARIGAFGLLCVAGAYMGLYVRSHNLLAPSLTELKQNYLNAGFTEEQALNFMVIKEFGMPLVDIEKNTNPVARSHHVSKSVELTESTPEVESQPEEVASVAQPSLNYSASALVQKQHSSLLFGAKVDVSGCDELSQTDNALPLEEVINNFELTGGEWDVLLTDILENVDEDDQKSALLLVKDAVCPLQEQEVTDCSLVNSTIIESPSEVTGTFKGVISEQWQEVVSKVAATELAPKHRSIAIQHIYRLLCND